MSAPTPSEARLAHWNGIPVFVNEMAVTRVCKVESVPIRKRRKGYRVPAISEDGGSAQAFKDLCEWLFLDGLDCAIATRQKHDPDLKLNPTGEPKQ